MRDHGGIRGFDPSVVTSGSSGGGASVPAHPARAIYFVSIIDLLQKYDLTKTMETKVRVHTVCEKCFADGALCFVRILLKV